MAFTARIGKQTTIRLPDPPKGTFDQDQEIYVEKLKRDIEGQIGSALNEARKPTHGDLTRGVIDVTTSGSQRVDIGLSQFTYGVPIVVRGIGLSGNASITGFDNSRKWVIAIVMNEDVSSTLTLTQGANMILPGGVDAVLSQYDSITILQIASDTWMAITPVVASS